MTECNQGTFVFTAHFSRRVEAGFTAGRVCSDGGSLLLREVDRKINLLGRLAGSFVDGRSPLLIKHRLSEMLAQRIFGLALGYEDLCDHEQLRSDPLLGLLSGKGDLDKPLAGKSTLNRLELVGRTGRYHKISYSAESVDRLLRDLFLESHRSTPEQIVLDLDATDIPLYGHQPERFFHGYYGSYCYLPLYIFAGDQLLCARLRARQSGCGGWIGGGAEAHCGAVACALVSSAHRAPSGQWLLSRGVNALVRSQPSRLRLRPGAQPATRKDHRRPDASSSPPTSEHSQAGPRLRRVLVSDPQKLVLFTPGCGQSGISRKGREPALCGHLSECSTVVCARFIREVLLRSRRDGEPHQGTDVPVC